MTESRKLLAEYVEHGSEAAFRELVARYVDLVYGTARRLLGTEAHLAEDVAQTVFINLARKGRAIPDGVLLGGWLHQHTFHVATKAVRSERRRQSRERQAAEMKNLMDHQDAAPNRVAPMLDEAITQLGTEDRAAILLRFFEQRDFRSVGEALGSSEDAARMRVNRALEKLHILLKKRGMTVSLTALAAALGAEAGLSAPAGLASALSGAALASTAAGTGTTLTLLKIMAASKLKAGLLAVALAGTTAALVIEYRAHSELRQQEQAILGQSDRLQKLGSENERLANVLSEPGDAASNASDELLRLRGQIGLLRSQTNALAGLREENRLLRQRTPAASDPQKSAFELREEQKEMGIAKLNYTKGWLMAFQIFADTNSGQFPSSFEQVSAIASSFTHSGAQTNLTIDQYEIVFQGALSNVPNPAMTIVIREKEAWPLYSGGWARSYAFADGHSEVHRSADGNFEPWERRHVIASPPGH